MSNTAEKAFAENLQSKPQQRSTYRIAQACNYESTLST